MRHIEWMYQPRHELGHWPVILCRCQNFLQSAAEYRQERACEEAVDCTGVIRKGKLGKLWYNMREGVDLAGRDV